MTLAAVLAWLIVGLGLALAIAVLAGAIVRVGSPAPRDGGSDR